MDVILRVIRPQRTHCRLLPSLIPKYTTSHCQRQHNRLILFRSLKMSTSVDGPDHLERTADKERENVKVGAVVNFIGNLSPTVKHVQLKIADSKFKFKAGQWVDVSIPGVPVVGGFSICSTYQEFVSSHLVDLAIKYSEHPPALWVSKQCKKGDHVVVRAGGECVYDRSTQEWQQPHQLMLIAGGIGINPLLSIMKEALEDKGSPNHLEKLLLLYSAARNDEVIFKDAIEELAKDSRVHFEVFVTREPSTPDENIKCGRLSSSHIQRSLQTIGLDVGKLHCYVCGPGEMIDDMEKILTESGIAKKRIHYERWW